MRRVVARSDRAGVSTFAMAKELFFNNKDGLCVCAVARLPWRCSAAPLCRRGG